jgi:integrase
VLRCLGILRGVLDLAVKDRRIRTNPAAGIENQPKKLSQKDRRYLDNATLARFATTVGATTLGVLVLVLGYTGLRWGEAIALRVRDVNPLRRRLHVRRNAVEVEGKIELGAPKNWEKRTVPYPSFLDAAIAHLVDGKGPDDLVFSDELGGFLRRPKTDEDSGSWFRAAQRSASIERFTIHDLRHTAASLAIASGAHVKAVQRMLGHKSAAMTLDTYADLFDDDLDDVAFRMGERGKTTADAALAQLGIAA